MPTPLCASSTDRPPRPLRPGSPIRTTACQGLLAGILVVAAAAPAAELHLPPGAIARLGETRFRHGDAVRSLVFSPDGKFLACGGHGLTLWEAATGKSLHPPGEKRPAWAAPVAFSPDGKHIVTAASRGVRVWDTSTGQLVRDLKGHSNGVEAVAWSDDGRWIASGSRDGTVRVWDAKAGTVAHVFPVSKGWAEQLVFAPGSRLLAAPCRDGTLRVWEPAAGKERHWFKDQKMAAAAAFSPDGSVLVWSSGGGGELRVWATDGESPPRVLRKGDGDFTFRALAFSPDGSTLAAGGTDSVVRLLEPKSGREIRRWTAPNSSLDALAYSPDGKTLVGGGRWSSAVHRWDPATGKEIDPSETHTAGVEHLFFPPGGGALLSLGIDNKVIRWDLTTRVPKAVNLPGRRIGALHDFSPDGKLVALAGWWNDFQVVKIFDTVTGRQLHTLEARQGAGTVAFANNGRWLAFLEDAGAAIRIWDLAEGKPRLRIEQRLGQRRFGRRATFPMLFSRDDRRLVSVGLDSLIRVYDTATGKLLQKHELASEVGPIDLSPDGKVLAFGEQDDIKPWVVLWDMISGKVVRTWETGQQQIDGTIFSPDGRLLATPGGYPRCSVKLWDVETKQELAHFTGQVEYVFPVAFSRDGRTLATGCADSTILLWDVTGRGGQPGKPLPAKRLQELWQDLADTDAKKAYAATWEMALSADGAVPFLRGRLTPVKAADPALVDRLVKKLAADDYATRQDATRELEKLGGGAVPRLRRALAAAEELETRRRIEALLAAYHRGGEWQRQRQALAALERGRSPAGRRLIEELAGGADGAPLTEEARAAVARMR